MSVSIPAGQDMMTPLGAYNFHVAFTFKSKDGKGVFDDVKVDNADDKKLGHDRDAIVGGFSEVSGLEASMEPKLVRAGGDNYRVHQRAGQVSFATVVLKRGLVTSRHLWAWFSLFNGANKPVEKNKAANGNWTADNRADVSILLIRSTTDKKGNPKREPVTGWKIDRAMPVKFRVGDLNAAGGEIAIEELHLAHEGLHLLLPSEIASSPSSTGKNESGGGT